jgi:hypothetical protein
MMINTCNPTIQEAEEGGSFSAWAELHETLSEK